VKVAEEEGIGVHSLTRNIYFQREMLELWDGD